MEQKFQFRVMGEKSLLLDKNREELMDPITRCPKCGKRMVPVVTLSGRTDLQCIRCDDPAVKWAESPHTAPEKPIAAENHSGRIRLLPP
jgi:hypothetical protein